MMTRVRMLVAGALVVVVACTPYFGSEGEDMPPRVIPDDAPSESGDASSPIPDASGASDASARGDATLDADGAPEPITLDATPATKRVFVSSVTFTGALGGVTSADDECTDLATAAQLGGTWKAYVAALGGEEPSARIAAGKRVLVDGTQVFSTGPASQAPLYPIVKNELNALIPEDLGKFVWTGLTSVATPASERTCAGWSTGAGTTFGGFGDAYYLPAWDRTSATASCDTSYRLYCFED